MVSKKEVKMMLSEWDNDFDGYCVYSFEFPNNKLYFGKTINIIQRIRSHHKKIKRSCAVLYKAIKKYGWNNIKIHLVERTNTEQSTLEKEIYYIALYKTNICRYGEDFGYNLTDGGEGMSGYVFTDETRKRMSESHQGEKNYNFGTTMSQETRNKIGEANRGKIRTEDFKADLSERQRQSGKWAGPNNPMFNKIFTREELQSRSEIQIGEKNSFYGKHHKQETKDHVSMIKRMFSPEIEKQILEEYLSGNISMKKLAVKYSVSVKPIFNIVKRSKEIK
jgi:group I intron endonuclease